MFKNLDKKLLHRFPLLWNTKFPYIILVGIVFHILAYFAGYHFIHFNLDGRREFQNTEEIVIMVTALFGVIILLIWFLMYIKNNGFKAFYPKSKSGLFKEWLLVFGVLFFFVLAIFSIEKGKEDRIQFLYSNLDFSKRIETVYKAGFFIDNPIERQEDYAKFNEVDSVYFDSDYFKFKDKNYPWHSLIARQKTGEYFTEKDSIYTVEVRNLLYRKDSVAVKKLMADYLQILKDQQLTTNLTVEKWYKAVYRAPNFENYSQIRPFGNSDENGYYQNENNNYLAEKSNYFVEQNKLFTIYKSIIYETERKNVTYDVILALFYFAFGFSVIILAFRTSKLLHWFISIVVVILLMILNISLLESNIYDEGMRYGIFTFAVLLEFMIIIFFTFLVSQSKKSKAVFLNLFLLSFGFVVPILFAGLAIFVRHQYNFSLKLFELKDENYYDDDFLVDVSSLNILVLFIGMFLFCRYIRNQKALPEN